MKNQKGFISILVIIIASIIMAGVATIGIIEHKRASKPPIVSNIEIPANPTVIEQSEPGPVQASIVEPTPEVKPVKKIVKNVVEPVVEEPTETPVITGQVVEAPTEEPIVNGSTIVTEPESTSESDVASVSQPEPPAPAPAPIIQPQPEPLPVPKLTTSATIQNIPDTVVSVKFSIVNTGQDVLKINNLRFRLDSYDKRVEGIALNVNIKFPNSADKNNEYSFDSMFSSDTNIFNTSYSCDPQSGWNGCTRCLEKIPGKVTCQKSNVFTNEILPNETAYITMGIGMANSFPSDGEPFKFTLEDGGIIGKTSGFVISTSDVKLESAPQPKSITASVLVKSLDSIPIPKEFVVGREQLSAIFNISTPVGLWIKTYTLTAIGDNVSNNHLFCNNKDLTSGIPRIFFYDLRTGGDTKLNVMCTASGETNAGTWQIRLDSIDAVDMNNGKPVIFTDLPAMGDKLTIIQQ